jgi:hypothetical protein
MSDKPIPWIAALDDEQVIAVQHGCGPTPINCYLDEYRNWTCPRCLEIYGAAFPLVGWEDAPKVEARPL